MFSLGWIAFVAAKKHPKANFYVQFCTYTVIVSSLCVGEYLNVTNGKEPLDVCI
jgi:hypothetical protein